MKIFTALLSLLLIAATAEAQRGGGMHGGGGGFHVENISRCTYTAQGLGRMNFLVRRLPRCSLRTFRRRSERYSSKV